MMKDDRTFGERIADEVAQFGGSWKFIITFCMFLVLWVIINTLALFDVIAWDKPPFILLNLVLSFIAAFQAPFIMMSQNRAEKKQDQAYRMLFQELKELVELDIEHEKEIEQLSKEIMKSQQAVRDQHARLLAILQEAILLQEVHKNDLADIIRHYEESDEDK
jgi:uncharacterized membrane protein